MIAGSLIDIFSPEVIFRPTSSSEVFMANKQETLGDAIEDEYYASAGVCTGTAYNEYLVSQRERSQAGLAGGILKQDRVGSYSSDPPRPSGGPYQLRPFMQKISDSLPWWLNLIVAVMGGALGMILGQRIDPSTDAAMWIFGVGGFCVGFVFLGLIVMLVDFLMQLMLWLVKLAIAVAIIGGVIYGLFQLIGNR
jgi:hypothetical protein